MKLRFKNKKISAIVTVLPDKEVLFEEEMHNYHFSEKKCLKLKKLMGYNKHRIVDENTTASDLGTFGIQYLIDQGILAPKDIDGLIVVTQSPDHFLPATSNIIQGNLNLGHDIFCMDINQGCAGYLIGLYQSFMMLNQPHINKIVLVNTDILSRKVSKQDRNSYPLVGDGASVTIVEEAETDSDVFAISYMDGTKNQALMIPAGGFKTPSTNETAELKDAGDHNFRSQEHLRMDGAAIFNFVQSHVPPLIEELMDYSGQSKDDIDYYLFHQPNKFMLQKLADKLEIGYDRLPNNIVENFGNASGVTVPTNICYNLGNKLEKKIFNLCLAGFGVGLTWSAMQFRIGPLDLCTMIDYPIGKNHD